MRKCKTCGGDLIRFIERKSYCMFRKRAKDNTHYHYGVGFYRYGVCEKHHYTRCNKTKVIWDPCIKCKMKGVTTKYRLKKQDTDSVDSAHSYPFSTKNNAYYNIHDEEITTIRLEMKQLKEELSKYKEKHKKDISRIQKKLKHENVNEQLFDLTELINMCTVNGVKVENKQRESGHSSESSESEKEYVDEIEPGEHISGIPIVVDNPVPSEIPIVVDKPIVNPSVDKKGDPSFSKFVPRM
jgi:hypothetical protein